METRPTPELFENLPLFAGDAKLCSRWPQLLEEWKRAFPLVDIETEVVRAHAEQEADILYGGEGRRKRQQARYLLNWFKKSQWSAERRSYPGTQPRSAGAPAPQSRGALWERIKKFAGSSMKINLVGREWEVMGPGLQDPQTLQVWFYADMETQMFKEVVEKLEQREGVT